MRSSIVLYAAAYDKCVYSITYFVSLRGGCHLVVTIYMKLYAAEQQSPFISIQTVVSQPSIYQPWSFSRLNDGNILYSIIDITTAYSMYDLQILCIISASIWKRSYEAKNIV